MSRWKDFNDANDDQYGDPIPKGTLAKACLHIKPGGYDDPEQDWTDGYATRSTFTGSVYLQAEFTIIEGPYAKRKLWHCIGLHSTKGPEWGDQGRTFIKQLLNSSHGLLPNDHSPQACKARQLNSFADLEGLICVIHIGIETDRSGEEKNTVQAMMTPRHKDYATIMGHANAAALSSTATHTGSQATTFPPPHTPHSQSNWT